MTVEIGIIGGSGLYDMAELADREERLLSTPFGDPSGPYVLGTLRGKRVAFLARHGVGHRLSPSELNYRANIYGFKLLGADWILSASAVGSLQEQYRPLDIVFPDQFIDRTRGRISTFFGNGIVAHVGFAHPLCGPLSKLAAEVARGLGATVHEGGTYVCWHPDHDAVTVEMIVDHLTKNATMAQQVIAGTVERVDVSQRVPAHAALKTALITHPNVIPDQVKRDLSPIIGKYLT